METNGDHDKNLEGNLREAACFGDERAVKIFVEGGVNINARHEINGWTPLHWAAKRGHVSIVKYLIDNGADSNIASLKGEKPVDLTESDIIRDALGALSSKQEKSDSPKTKLPIVPNYIANPVLNYNIDVSGMGPVHIEKNTENPFRNSVQASNGKEMVIKVRVADLPLEADFIEIDIPFPDLSYANFVQACCKELKVDYKKVLKVRKLPNTLIRNDKDLSRLKPFQEVEFAMNYIPPQIQVWQNQSQIASRGNNHYLHQRQIIAPTSNNQTMYRNGDSLMEKSAYCRNGTLLY